MKNKHNNNKTDIKRYLKTVFVALVAVGLCSWALHRIFFNHKTSERYNDYVVDSSLDWLENSDRGDFSDCQNQIIDKDGWFKLFTADRKGLGELKLRTLASRRELSGAARGMKRYELKFAAMYNNNKLKSNVMDQLIVESDNQSFKVINASFWLKFQANKVTKTDTEDLKEPFKKMADDVLQKIDDRDAAFFKQAIAVWLKHPDYFGWSSWLNSEVKSGKTISTLFDTLSKGKHTPWIYIKTYRFSPVGRTGFECVNRQYSSSIEVNGSKKNYSLFICIDRDLYLDKDAKWKLFSIFWHEDKKK